MKGRNKALFLDRDGTIIEHVPYLHDPDQVRLTEGAGDALRKALLHGFHLFLFTNQSGVGRGMFAMEEVEACNQRMLELLELPSPGFTAVCVAVEAPDEPVQYRKPSPRFILEMIQAFNLNSGRSWMIGDDPVDMAAAVKAAIRGIQVSPDFQLAAAVDKVIGEDSEPS